MVGGIVMNQKCFFNSMLDSCTYLHRMVHRFVFVFCVMIIVISFLLNTKSVFFLICLQRSLPLINPLLTYNSLQLLNTLHEMNTLGPDPAVMAAIEKGNKVVFFDIEMGEIGKSTPLGRIKMELFVKEVRYSRLTFFQWSSFQILVFLIPLSSFFCFE